MNVWRTSYSYCTTWGCKTISSIPHGCVCVCEHENVWNGQFKKCLWVDNSIQILHKTLMRGRFKKWWQKHFNLSRCVTGVWWSCSWLLLARLSFPPFQLNPLKYDWSTCCPLLDRYSKFKWAAGQHKRTLFVTRWEQMSEYCQEHCKNVCGEMRKYIWIQIVSYCVTEMLW